jgi:glycosyltransferase involved in cell wall biosynthesis
MKIVHTLLRYPPATGGVEDYAKELVERLRTKGDDVLVETTNLKIHHPPTVFDPLPVDPPYVHRHDAHTFDSVGYPIPVNLKEELQQMEMDILHAHAFWYAPADIAARVAKHRNIPFVLNTYYYNTDNRRSMKWQLYRILYGRATVAAADAVVVISPYEQELLKRDGFMLDRVELIPPGIEAETFAQKKPNPFLEWNVRAKNILLFAGRIAKAKGVDLLISALPQIIKQIPDTHLVLIGEDFGFRKTCEEQAKRLGVEQFITWTGKTTRDQLIGAYQNATAFVFPSRFEAFGIVLLEAGAAGCPIVATNGSAIPYIVRPEKTGLLFEPENFNDLATKVIQLLKNNNHAKEMAENARCRAHTEFAWEQSVAKLQQLYVDLLKDKNDRLSKS